MDTKPYDQAVAYLQEKLGGFAPEIGLTLGSGLGDLAQQIENPIFIPYGEIPGFAESTAPDHVGRFVAGTLAGKKVLCMQGRLHFYEGHSLADVIFPVRVMYLLGIKTLILTNASGGINLGYQVGDFMLIDDHINLTGQNPMIGQNNPRFGKRFFDMTYAWTPALKEAAFAASAKCGVPLQRGVYLGLTGPNFETPAEIRAFRTWGADAVGMSTVPEALAAAQCGMPLLGISMITNAAAGVLDQKIDGADVNETAARRGAEFQKLITAVLEEIKL